MLKQWDAIDAEMEKQANAIRSFHSNGAQMHTAGRGSRTIKCRMTHKRQQPASSSVIVAHAERKTGLRSDVSYVRGL